MINLSLLVENSLSLHIHRIKKAAWSPPVFWFPSDCQCLFSVSHVYFILLVQIFSHLATIVLEVFLSFNIGTLHNQPYSRFSGHFNYSHSSLKWLEWGIRINKTWFIINVNFSRVCPIRSFEQIMAYGYTPGGVGAGQSCHTCSIPKGIQLH